MLRAVQQNNLILAWYLRVCLPEIDATFVWLHCAISTVASTYRVLHASQSDFLYNLWVF